MNPKSVCQTDHTASFLETWQFRETSQTGEAEDERDRGSKDLRTISGTRGLEDGGMQWRPKALLAGGHVQ